MEKLLSLFNEAVDILLKKHREHLEEVEILVYKYDNAAEDEKKLEIASKLINLLQKMML